MTSVRTRVWIVIAAALLAPVLDWPVLAQTTDDAGGFVVREVSVSTGYAAVQPSRMTPGVTLPAEILNADLIASAAAAINWRRVMPRNEYALDLSGLYNARARYSQLNAPGGNLTFSVSRALEKRWRLKAGVAGAIANSDELSYQPTQARRMVEGTVQVPLFAPIGDSLDRSHVYGNRIIASSATADVAYAHSVRLAAFFRGTYTALGLISTTHVPAQPQPLSKSFAEDVAVGIRYARSQRSQFTAAVDWLQTSGDAREDTVIATVGYGWAGRKWFTDATAGAALRPFQTSSTSAPLARFGSRTTTIVGSAFIGYRFRTQTLLVQYRSASHDEYGYGGGIVATGFEGDVQSIGGWWSWSAVRTHWLTESAFSLRRRPGDLWYGYAWLSTTGVGRQLGPRVRLMGEVLFERHGSRLFEGLHLSQEGARVHFIWTPALHSADRGPSRQ